MSAATGSDAMTPQRQAAGAPERQAAGAPQRRAAGTPERRAAGTPQRQAAGGTPIVSADDLIDDPVDGVSGAFGAAITRRILEHRGSTTALLTELSGATISLRLLEQRIVDRLLVPADVASVLRATAERAEVILRRSALFDVGERLLSLNCTVAPVGLPEDVATALTSAQTPIGIGLDGLGLAQRREFRARGRTRWPGRATGRCAFREYLILLDDQPVLFVHEAFNPALFPVDEVPVGPTPAFLQSGPAGLVLGPADGRSA
ncbi:hypothetical protein [Actinoalloteichus sp. GBA129-24]|uniref:hypothetical protein n=1 Tax=Actinoalloteichus sp. GBA129-24 TaxID=1612551 RepID=UPI0009504C41|nr:hypothetical protein [Actinoalloteichus sp. GBA129-24]APU19320.1 chorismate lyase [Actinoalloteichus sp. GBA129-24]